MTFFSRSVLGLILTFLITGAAPNAAAQTDAFTEKPKKSAAPTCPDPGKLKHLCTSISGRMPDRTGKQKYLYQSKFYQAACVLPEEPLTVAAAKIRQVWDAYPEKLRCTSGGFDVVEGNILKLAFSGEFEEFLNDAIRWKVNLNIVDPSDNHTVLDYVEKWIGINKGNSLEQRYKNYYTKLREAGALHQREL